MSRRRLEFPNPERFVIGTVGVPGERQFYLQIRAGARISSFALEKAQAAALSDRARELLKEINQLQGPADQDAGPLATPVESEFTIGVMSLTWEPESKEVLFEAQSATDSSGERFFEDFAGDEVEGAPALASARLTLSMLRGFIIRTRQVVSAGRQPCVFCGGPIDPTGHLCPRANGHLRRP